MPRILALLFAAIVLTAMASGQTRPQRGIVGKIAPSWGVTKWYNLPEGESSIDITDYRGKVVYLYCFQSWCPGCHSRGFPTLTALIEKYGAADDVAFVAVQTAFEGHRTNNAAAALRTAKRYDLKIPVGHDGTSTQRPAIMSRYRTGGTPWTIIIDKSGRVRFNAFHANVANASTLIDRLRANAPEPVTPPRSVPRLPVARGGQDVVGKPMPHLEFDRWVSPRQAPGKMRKPARGRVALYRWWTDGCRFCVASLPAIESLRTKYRREGLDVVAVYHPKPPRATDDATARRFAEQRGYHGLVAIDEDWSELRRWYYQGTESRPATSVSVLVDDRGVVRFVHPGPILFPSADPEHTRENEDFTLLDQAIQAVLAESRARAAAR